MHCTYSVFIVLIMNKKVSCHAEKKNTAETNFIQKCIVNITNNYWEMACNTLNWTLHFEVEFLGVKPIPWIFVLFTTSNNILTV